MINFANQDQMAVREVDMEHGEAQLDDEFNDRDPHWDKNF